MLLTINYFFNLCTTHSFVDSLMQPAVVCVFSGTRFS
jgi:hypothetical protein